MDKLTTIVSEGLSRYYNTLSNTGYKSYKEVNKLILLIFIEELLQDNILSLYISDKDYNIINSALSCLYGTSCLIPYPEFKAQKTSLIQSLDVDTPRITYNDVIRFTEDGLFRLVNQ